jgi:hypothetical protein
MFDLAPIEDLEQRRRLAIASVARVGNDVRILARIEAGGRGAGDA